MFTPDTLRECLLAVPEFDLAPDVSVAGLLPNDIPRDRLRGMLTDLLAYTERCQFAAEQIATLQPVPLAIPLDEAYR